VSIAGSAPGGWTSLDVELTTHLSLAPSSRMSGAISPLPYIIDGVVLI
jgi:hypothetical protein